MPNGVSKLTGSLRLDGRRSDPRGITSALTAEQSELVAAFDPFLPLADLVAKLPTADRKCMGLVGTVDVPVLVASGPDECLKGQSI